jgi:NAD(P)-dependent dehydrogenase (short-subunit alcohol dehydrogenase family)
VGGLHFAELPPVDFDRVMRVNARGPYLCARALYLAMRATGSGRIVNIASDVTFYGPPRLLHYVSSKGAVVAMTRAMARDAGPDGITVNAVAPGMTETESTRGITASRHELFQLNRALTRAQQPDDVTGAVRFLLSDAAAYITGQTLLVDGGFVCR